MKILYTFDEGPQCLARSSLSREIRVIYGEDQAPLGIIDLYTCLQCVVVSSPEIMSNLHFYDYAVYSTDYTEPGNPLVGHGMFSWLHLSSEALANSENAEKGAENQLKLVVGRVCTNILALFSGGSKETLEVNLRLKPISNCTQAQYLRSIQLYKGLAAFLPPNFDHPAWASFLSQNPNLSNFLQEPQIRQHNLSLPHREISTSQTTSNKRDQSNDTRYLKRQKSVSPPPTSNEILYDADSFNKVEYAPTSNGYIGSSSPPLTSSSLMSNLESDAITTYSSPQPPYESLSIPNSLQNSLVNSSGMHFSVSRATKTGWMDTPTSPITMSSPLAQNDRSEYIRPQKPIKRSLSTTTNVKASRSASIDQSDSFKVVARGPKYRQRDRAIKSLYEAVAEGEASLFCQNCGKVDPSTWRRIKTIPTSSSGEEKEYLLCNPCGLWYSSKRTMRPSHLWSKDLPEASGIPASSPIDEPANTNPKPKEKPTRRRRGPNKQHEDYVGPSIAELLAQNVRNKSLNSQQIASSNSKMEADPSKEESNDINEPAITANDVTDVSDGNDSNERKDGDSKDGKDLNEANDAPTVPASPPISAENTPGEEVTDSGDGTKKKKQERVKNSTGSRVSKKPREKKTVPRKTKKWTSLSGKNEPILIAPAPVSGQMEDQTVQKLATKNPSIVNISENNLQDDNTETTTTEMLEKEHFKLSVEDKENAPPAGKDTVLAEPGSPAFSLDQLNFLLMTPQKARKTDSNLQQEEFEFFDNASFSGSPSRWISKLLSSGSKSFGDHGFGPLGDVSDDAFRAILKSPSKINHDVFESIARDLGMDPSTSIDFGKLGEPVKDSTADLSAAGATACGKLKTFRPLNESVPISPKKRIEVANNSSPPSNISSLAKSMSLASSPPQQFYPSEEQTNTSDGAPDIWSDSPTANNDEALTVKISPEATKD